MGRSLPKALSAAEKLIDRGHRMRMREARVAPDVVARFLGRCELAIMEGNPEHLHSIADDFAAGLAEAALANVSVSSKLALCTPIAQLGLRTRTANILDDAGVYTLGALLGLREGALLALPNFGVESLREVLAAVECEGFRIVSQTGRGGPPDGPEKNMG